MLFGFARGVGSRLALFEFFLRLGFGRGGLFGFEFLPGLDLSLKLFLLRLYRPPVGTRASSARPPYRHDGLGVRGLDGRQTHPDNENGNCKSSGHANLPQLDPTAHPIPAPSSNILIVQ